MFPFVVRLLKQWGSKELEFLQATHTGQWKKGKPGIPRGALLLGENLHSFDTLVEHPERER